MLLVILLYLQESVIGADTVCADCSSIPTNAGLIPSNQLNAFTSLLGLGPDDGTFAVVGASNGGIPPAPSNNAFASSPAAVLPLTSQEQPDTTTNPVISSLNTIVVDTEINPEFSNGGSLIGPVNTPSTITTSPVIIPPLSPVISTTLVTPVNSGNGGTFTIPVPDTTVTVPAVSCSTTTIVVDGPDVVRVINVAPPSVATAPDPATKSCSLDVVQYLVTSISYGTSIETSTSIVVASSTVQTTLYSDAVTFVAQMTLLCTNTLYYFSTVETQNNYVSMSYSTLMICDNNLVARFVEGDEMLSKTGDPVSDDFTQDMNGAPGSSLGYAHLIVFLIGVILWF